MRKETLMFRQERCSLRMKLVEDLPGEHVYIHACRNCGQEYGEEFTVFHASTGKTSDPLPMVTAPICFGHPQQSIFDVSRHEAVYGFGFTVANA